jgi:GNAT superfamily N-acetyltransferase
MKSQTIANISYQKEKLMSRLAFRPFNPTDEEYNSLIALWNAVWPEHPTHMEAFKHSDESRNPDHYWHRLVAELDGRITGFGVYCETWWSKKPGKYYITFLTAPECQQQGIATAFYDHVMGILQQRNPFNLLTADTREDQEEAIHFLTKRGFKQMMRYPISYLDVPSFDPSKYTYAAEKIENAGITLNTATELMERDPDWLHKLWELDIEIMKDVPSPDPITRQPFEEFKKLVDSPNFTPDAFVIAVENDGRFVGTSALWRNKAKKEWLYTGLTGVLRSHRRMGLATAMKAKALTFAKEYGAEIVETDNEENNPMYQLNMQLGFKPQPAWLDFHKEIKSAEG